MARHFQLMSSLFWRKCEASPQPLFSPIQKHCFYSIIPSFSISYCALNVWIAMKFILHINPVKPCVCVTGCNVMKPPLSSLRRVCRSWPLSLGTAAWSSGICGRMTISRRNCSRSERKQWDAAWQFDSVKEEIVKCANGKLSWCSPVGPI